MDDMYGFGNYDRYMDNQAVGVYTPYNQFEIDPIKLQSLGFTSQEIGALQYIVANGGKASTSALVGYGMDYETANRLKYMYDITAGKIAIESIDDLVKHLRRMFGGHRRIGINDLALSQIQNVPRMAVVAGIKDETFSIYNSTQYPANERMYSVTDVSNGRIFIETERKPVLKYKQSKKIDGVIEIVEVKPNNKLIVAINKEYARLCNRFIIVGSLKKPEFHLGLVQIICIEGTKVYIYAHCMGTKDTVRYNGGTQRVYDYGFFSHEIQPKLMRVAAEMYRLLSGVYALNEPANSDFVIVPPEEKEEAPEDAIEE